MYAMQSRNLRGFGAASLPGTGTGGQVDGTQPEQAPGFMPAGYVGPPTEGQAMGPQLPTPASGPDFRTLGSGDNSGLLVNQQNTPPAPASSSLPGWLIPAGLGAAALGVLVALLRGK